MESTVRRVVFAVLVPVVLVILLGVGMDALAKGEQGSGVTRDAATPEVWIVPAEGSVSRCGTLTATVWVTDVANLGAYEFKMDWDPTVFTVTQVVDGGFLSSTGRDVYPQWPPP